jgi:hypothetical protein
VAPRAGERLQVGLDPGAAAGVGACDRQATRYVQDVHRLYLAGMDTTTNAAVDVGARLIDAIAAQD